MARTRPGVERDNRGFRTRCTKGGCKPMRNQRMPGAGLSREEILERRRPKSHPSSRTGENPPYGMIGGIMETSASSKPDQRLDPTRLRHHLIGLYLCPKTVTGDIPFCLWIWILRTYTILFKNFSNAFFIFGHYAIASIRSVAKWSKHSVSLLATSENPKLCVALPPYIRRNAHLPLCKLRFRLGLTP